MPDTDQLIQHKCIERNRVGQPCTSCMDQLSYTAIYSRPLSYVICGFWNNNVFVVLQAEHIVLCSL